MGRRIRSHKVRSGWDWEPTLLTNPIQREDLVEIFKRTLHTRRVATAAAFLGMDLAVFLNAVHFTQNVRRKCLRLGEKQWTRERAEIVCWRVAHALGLSFYDMWGGDEFDPKKVIPLFASPVGKKVSIKQREFRLRRDQMHIVKASIVLLCLLASVSTARAQSCPADVPVGTVVLNANGICYVASDEHDATDPVSGTAVLTGYSLCFFASGVDSADPAVQPIQACTSLGKPTPAGPNKIIQMARSEFGAVPVGALYKAVITADGPGGSLRSPGSHGFFGRPINRPPHAPGAPIIFHQ